MCAKVAITILNNTSHPLVTVSSSFQLFVVSLYLSRKELLGFGRGCFFWPRSAPQAGSSEYSYRTIFTAQ